MSVTRLGQASRLPETPEVDEKLSRHGPLSLLVVLAMLSTCLYGVIALLSWRFDYDRETTERPIIAVLALLAATFTVYLWAIWSARRAPQNRRLLAVIVWAAVLFRVVMLFSVPIQEIDIYRYLWDGAVTRAGVSPFRYSPEQVRTADASTEADEQLQTLVALRDSQPALAEILRRVHFGELPTVYPPSSQAVFAAAAVTTPTDAPVLVRVFIMKAWLIGFDVATLALVIGLLRLCQKPVGLCVIYAWCPLLLKEVANSGHLDSIAVFLTTLAVYLAVRLVAISRHALASGSAREPRASAPRLMTPATARGGLYTIVNATLVGLVLALAVGAKLYPVVLAPLLFGVLVKIIGWGRATIPAVAFSVATFFVVSPMLPTGKAGTPNLQPQEVALGDPSAVPTHVPSPPATSSDPSVGMKTFLRQWEMNDFIFLLLVENLKPSAELPPNRVAWFSIVPETIRQQVAANVAATFHTEPREAPFLTARAVTGLAFLVVAVCLAWRTARRPEVSRLCEAGFLTLAWFWLLCPTQNPWYWTWPLPLLPFVRNRVWLAVSGLVLLYYLRFWFSYHWPDTSVLGTGYIGFVFFDYVVTWLEFAPWLFWLTLSYVLTRQFRCLKYCHTSVMSKANERATETLNTTR